jgi:hypothetical protein
VAIWRAIPSNQSAKGPVVPAVSAPTTNAVTEAPKTTKPETDKGAPPKTDAGQSAAGGNETKTKPPKTDNAGKPTVPETNVSEKPQPPPETVTPPAGAKPIQKVVGKYLSPAEAEPDVLLTRADDKDAWKWLGHNAPVSTENSLLTLAGYRSQVRLNNGLELILWGDLPYANYPALVLDSALVLHDASDVDLDLTLNHGRVAITNPKPDPKRVRVHFQDQAWELTLENAATVALELSGKVLPGFSREVKDIGQDIFVGLFVLKGHVQLKVGNGTYSLQEPKGPALFVWGKSTGPQGPLPLDRLPPWAEKPVPFNQPPATVKALGNLSKRLKNRSGVDTVLAEMVNEETGPNPPLAIYGLAAVQNLHALLDVLADEHHATARQVALGALRYWLGQHPDHDQQLYAALKAKYKSADPAEIILALLHGYTREERAKPETYEQLIEYLLSDNLPIRELAAWQLRALPETEELAKKIPYDPAGGIDQRNAAHDLWKKDVPTGQMPRKGPPPPNGTPRSRK